MTKNITGLQVLSARRVAGVQPFAGNCTPGGCGGGGGSCNGGGGGGCGGSFMPHACNGGGCGSDCVD